MKLSKYLACSLTALCLLCALTLPALAAPAQVTLTVKQTLTSSNAQLVYQLKPASPSNPMPQGTAGGVYSFAIAGSADFAIGPIAFPKPGKYSYELRHRTAPMTGYIYDQTVYTLEVYTKNDGTYSVVIIKEGGGKKANAEYRHSYEDQTSDPLAMVDPPVVKTVIGTPPAPETFTFKLVAGNPSNPMPSGAKDGVKTMQIKGSGSGEFGTWVYTKAGVYFYTVSEVNTGSKDYAYDAVVYTIQDTVSAVDGRLEVSRIVTNASNRQVTSLSFINTYTGGSTPPSSQPPPTVTTARPGIPNTNPSRPYALPGTDDEPVPGLPYTVPKTGDESKAQLFIAIFCAGSAAALASAGYLLFGRKNRRKKEQ